MAHVQDTVPAHSHESTGGTGFLFGVILLLVGLFLFFFYGLPLIQNATSGPTLNVPDKVDVNVQQGK